MFLSRDRFKAVVCYVQPFLEYQTILEKLDLKAFDLGKIIELFLKAMPSLPQELQEHLLAVDEELIESGSWEAGSSVYGSIVQATEHCQDPPSSGEQFIYDSYGSRGSVHYHFQA